jgi:hypothetical protein
MKGRFLAFLLLLKSAAFAQPAFQHSYAMGSQNEGKAAAIAANHDLYFAGTTNDNNLSQSNIYLLCTDSAGNFRWQRSYGGGGVEQGTGLTLLADQTLMIGGYSNSFNLTSDYDGYILRVDAAGDTLWTRHVGTGSWDFLTSQCAGIGDTVVFAGYSYGNGSSLAQPWIVKALSDGSIASTRILPIGEECFVNKVKVLSDGKILLGGYYGTGPNNPDDAWLGLCDASLDTIWNRRIDYGHAERICGLDQFPNGDYLFAGRLTLSTNGFDQNMIGRMDNAGSIAWTNIAGGDSTYDGFDDVFIRNDTLFCGATTATFGQGARDFQLITFDGAGTFLIGKTYGGPEGDQVRSCIPGEFGGVILTGYSNSFPVDQQTLFVVRTDSALESTNNTVIGVSELSKNNLMVYPNPVRSNQELTVSSAVPLQEIVLTDLSGRIVLRQYPNRKEINLAITSQSAGIYLLGCRYQDNDWMIRKVMISGDH